MRTGILIAHHKEIEDIEMLNLLLNRYYITNAGRSVVSAETQAKVQGLLAAGHIGEQKASGSAGSVRGKEPHDGRRRELQGLWMRQLGRNEECAEHNGNTQIFCKNN